MITVTEFETVAHNHGARKTLSWEEFIASISPLPRETKKKDLPVWSAASFSDDEKQKGSLVEEVSLLVFDVDVAPVPSREELEQALAGCECAFYPSSSSTEELPRWRLIFPLDRPASPADYVQTWKGVKEELPFPVGEQSKNPSRVWFAAREPDGGLFEVHQLHGAPIPVQAAPVAKEVVQRTAPKADP